MCEWLNFVRVQREIIIKVDLISRKVFSTMGIECVNQTSHIFEGSLDKVRVSGCNVLLHETHRLEEFVARFTTEFSLVFLFHMRLHSAGCFPKSTSAPNFNRAATDALTHARTSLRDLEDQHYHDR